MESTIAIGIIITLMVAYMIMLFHWLKESEL